MNSKVIAPVAVASAIAIGGAGYMIGSNNSDDDYVEPSIVSTVAPETNTLTIENAKYIGNANSMKFHYSWCDSVSDMNDYNKVPFASASDARADGYKACKRCAP